MQPKVTIGRIVRYFQVGGDKIEDKPRTAIVTQVWDEDTGMANLTVFDHNGMTFAKTSVPQKEHAHQTSYWDWPPRV